MSLSVALTKGRLESQTVAMLEKSGYGIERLRNKGRALVFPDTKKDIRYFLVKANDCITYVEHGVAEIRRKVEDAQHMREDDDAA